MIDPAVLGGLISGGGALLGGSKSKKGGGGGPSDAAESAARLQAQIASQLFNQTSPLRAEIFGGGELTPEESDRLSHLETVLSLRGPEGVQGPDLEQLNRLRRKAARGGTGQLPDFLSTGELPEALSIPFTATREGIEDQFGVARENILSRIPARGGQLNELLADVETGRARAIGQIPLQELPLRESLFNQAIQVASASPVQAASVAGGAGNIFQNLAAQEAASAQASGQAIGSAASLATKLALGKNRTGNNPVAT